MTTTTTETPNSIEQDILHAIKVIQTLNLKAEVTGAWVWVHGNLKANEAARRVLKKEGFRFASKKKMWYYAAVRSGGKRGGKSMTYIRTKYGSIRVEADK